MHVRNNWIVDESDRVCILRGVNLGSSSKVPYTPDGSSRNLNGFYDYRNVSFVGRPFPLAEADEHFKRLKAWGFNFLRFLVTWEAIEHAGPGIYDEKYLDYLEAVLSKAAEYGISVFIDPHQDVWSRWTGGDGAPAWTLESIGIDIKKIHTTGAAFLHSESNVHYPKMIWPTNYQKYGAATLFTLFFGGNDFAPLTKVDGTPIQEFLQRHYFNAMKAVAKRIGKIPSVIGFGTLNEPHYGYIGVEDLSKISNERLKIGITPTYFQGMLAASGYPQETPIFALGPSLKYGFTRITGESLLNPGGVRIWKDGYECVWKQNGVWNDAGGQPQLIHPDYFLGVKDKAADFTSGYLKPFLKNFTNEIRLIRPEKMIFIEEVPGKGNLDWKESDGKNVVNAGHWYDGFALILKRYFSFLTLDADRNIPVFGTKAVGQSYSRQLASVKAISQHKMGGIPTLIGEFGLPFDLNSKKSYRTNQFKKQIQALNAYYNAMDDNLLSCTIWNYTVNNTNEYGDGWNDEDLSIFSRDQQRKPPDIHSGGRALEGFCRPYAMKIAGIPVKMNYNRRKGEFNLVFEHIKNMNTQTEIFVPDIQFPDGFSVTLSDGTFEAVSSERKIIYYHTEEFKRHQIIVKRIK